MTTLIELKDVHFSYGKNEALKGINLKLKKGDFITLFGENGSGKSTLVKLLTSQLKPNKGDIIFSPLIKAGSIGYVPQIMPKDILGFPITVSEIVALSFYPELNRWKMLNENHKGKIKEVLELVGMYEFKDELFQNLSGGQKQRVLIAKSLIGNIELLIMDEPTNGIDINMKNTLNKLLHHLNEAHGISIFIITHENYFIKESKNSITIKDGRLII